MKIGILGSGGVAQTLGNGFLANGHQVMLGTRDTSKLSDWHAQAGERAKVGSFADAASFGVVIVVAVAGEAALDAARLAGVDHLEDKTLIDVTNPLDFSGGMPPKFTVTVGNSIAEQLQRALPEAHVVKAFNMVTASVMVDPRFGDERGTLFIVGNDKNAKSDVAKLAEEFGWEVLDFGPIEQAFYLEAFAFGFITYAFQHNDWLRSIRFLGRSA